MGSDALEEKAWKLYCEETKGSPAAVDFPHEVPKEYWKHLLKTVKSLDF